MVRVVALPKPPEGFKFAKKPLVGALMARLPVPRLVNTVLAVSKLNGAAMVRVWPPKTLFVTAGLAPCKVNVLVAGEPGLSVTPKLPALVTEKPAMVWLLFKPMFQAADKVPSGKMAMSVATAPGGPEGVQLPGVAQDPPLVSVDKV